MPAMPSARIQPLDPPFPPDIQAEFDKIMRGAPPLLLFRTVARNPRVLQRWLAGGLLDKGSISLRLRELMILRTTALCGAEYEWGVHVASFGAKAQWTGEQIRSTVHGDAADPCWSEQEQCVILLADQLHASNKVTDQAWQRITSSFAGDQLVELVTLCGLYHMVSFTANALGVPHEEFAPRFPDAPPHPPAGSHGPCAA
jgi:alkylhydroperoxidase family enzyme